MREIKFRFWNTLLKQMGQSHSLEEWTIHKQNEAKNNPSYTFTEGELTNVIPLQFTEFTDINDVEIYEGDIVKATGRSDEQESIVVFETKLGGWMLEDTYWTKEFGNNNGRNGLATFIQAEIKGNILVIGNIYDNPELLRN